MLPVPQVVPGIVDKLFQPLTLENLLLSGQATGNQVRYAVQGTATSAAAGVAELGNKPESTLGFGVADEPVKKVATSIQISDELLEDAPAVQTFVNGQLSTSIWANTNPEDRSGDSAQRKPDFSAESGRDSRRTVAAICGLLPQPHGFESLLFGQEGLRPDGLLALESDEDADALVDWDAAAGPAPRDVRQHEHVLAEVNDLLSLEAVVLPGLDGVRPQLPHLLGAPVDPVGVKRLQLELCCKANSQQRLHSLGVFPGPGLADFTKPLHVLLRHRPPSIPLRGYRVTAAPIYAEVDSITAIAVAHRYWFSSKALGDRGCAEVRLAPAAHEKENSPSQGPSRTRPSGFEPKTFGSVDRAGKRRRQTTIATNSANASQRLPR